MVRMEKEEDNEIIFTPTHALHISLVYPVFGVL
jgi:hypothetical protein